MSSQVLKPIPPTSSAPVSDEVRERIAVRGTLRCPYCHDGCEPSGSVACRDCLARHHATCWQEQGACSSCGSTHRLVAEATPTLTRGQLLVLLRQGRSEDVQAYYRDQGESPESALRLTAELAFDALSGTQEARSSWGAAALFTLQGVGLLVCSLVALDAAEPGVWSGLATLVLSLLALCWVRVRSGEGARGALRRQTGLMLTGLLIAPALINALNIAPSDDSAALFFLGLVLTLTSWAFGAGFAWRRLFGDAAEQGSR